MAADDSTYVKMLLPALEKHGNLHASDALEETLKKLESHMTTQRMMAVSTRSSSKATKSAKERGVRLPDGNL